MCPVQTTRHWRPPWDSNPGYRRESGVTDTMGYGAARPDTHVIIGFIDFSVSYRFAMILQVFPRNCGRFVGSLPPCPGRSETRRLIAAPLAQSSPPKNRCIGLTIARGFAIGYRKGAKGGMWLAKLVRDR